MSKIVIIGAGAMGSAFSLPCLDNNHDINIVGTHLENDFIDQLDRNNNLHPGLNTKIPKEIKIHKFIDKWKDITLKRLSLNGRDFGKERKLSKQKLMKVKRNFIA